MKYFLFAGINYYPQGGAEDFRGEFDSADDAKKSIAKEIDEKHIEWAHITDQHCEMVECIRWIKKDKKFDWGKPYEHRRFESDFT